MRVPKDHFSILSRRPKTAGRRLALVGIFSLATILIALGIFVGSVWIEDHFPSDDAQRALAPEIQQAITKPVVNVLSRQVERLVRRRVEALYMRTGLTLEETLARFLDDRVDLVERRVYAYRLARIGSPECIDALLKVFQNAPPEHKAFMAQLIGSTGNPDARQWLTPLLNDANDQVAVAAIAGLSAIGGDNVTTQIAAILADGNRPDGVRAAAAGGLGSLGTPRARDALIEWFNQAPDGDLKTQALTSLGRFDFPTVADTFERYLASPETPGAMRVAAAEALAHSSDQAVPFLMDLAGHQTDANVRASAAWAISLHDAVGNLGPTLSTLAEHEPVADVRRRLYEALLTQDFVPANELLPRIQEETDLSARVAGFNAVGRAAHQQPGSSVAETFDTKIVPELLQIATDPNSLNLQMRAVFALRRAQTPAAWTALAAIADRARPAIASAARHGLEARKIQPSK